MEHLVGEGYDVIFIRIHIPFFFIFSILGLLFILVGSLLQPQLLWGLVLLLPFGFVLFRLPEVAGISALVIFTNVLSTFGYQHMIRTDRWKLIYYPKINRHQLFDLKNDPDELNEAAPGLGNAISLARRARAFASAGRRGQADDGA